MSLNQSRSEKNESHFRKPGGPRFGTGGSGGQHRNFSGGRGGGRGGGAPTGPTATAPTVSTNRSYKKINNVQGGHSKGTLNPANPLDSNATTGARPVENGGYAESSLHGVSSAPAPAPAPVKPACTSTQKRSQPLPRAPSSQSSSMTSDSTQPSTPAKGDGDKGFALQFGSISPGFMNGMQVPARTSSAPPNLDEQKRDQARLESSRAVPPVPLPSAPKQEVPKKDAAPVQQSIAREIHPEPKAKRDVQVVAKTPPTEAQLPPALPLSGISMPLPFHQPTASMQFAGPQIRSQGLATSSLQMPIQMPLQMGNPSQVPQQVFLPGFQHHLMQSQGIMHQGQNLGFNHQMGAQLPHQLVNIRMNVPNQFSPQHAAKFVSPRKAVKITHPDTHEELRLDSIEGGSSGSRPHHSVPSQSQPMPSYTPTHSSAYYSNSYATGPSFSPAQSSLPSSTQLSAGTQAPKYNYPVTQAPANLPFVNHSASNIVSVSSSGASMHGSLGSYHGRDRQNIELSVRSASNPVTIKAVGGSGGEKIMNSDVVAKGVPQKLMNQGSELGAQKVLKLKADSSSLKPVQDTVAAETSGQGASSILTESPTEALSDSTRAGGGKGESLNNVGAIEDDNEQLGKIECQPTNQVIMQADTTVHTSIGSSKDVVSESAETKAGHFSSKLEDGASETIQAPSVIVDAAPAGVSKFDLGTESSSDPSDDNISKEAAVGAERKEEHVGESCSNNFSKDEEALKQPVEDGRLNNVDHLTVAMKLPQKEDTCSSHSEGDKMCKQTSISEHGSSMIREGSNTLDSNSSMGMMDRVSGKDDAGKSTMSECEATSVSADVSDANSEHEKDTPGSLLSSSSTEIAPETNRTAVEANKMKNNKGKKKLKDILQKADALGTTSDLYMAYKGPDERREASVVTEVSPGSNLKDVSSGVEMVESKRNNEDEQSKTELDDWEDAADISTPKLQSADKGIHGGSLHDDEGVTAKKYSRDFLLTFAEQYVHLPEGFETRSRSDIDALMRINVNASHGDREYPTPARVTDRVAGTARLDRRGSGTMDADRWNKLPSPYPPGRDPGLDLAYGSNLMGFRAGAGPNFAGAGPNFGVAGPNFGVLRNPRAQGPLQPAGGILSGPMHAMGFQGIQRNNSDTDRWQRATNFNKGLMPAPHTPMQVMHKAEMKYEVGKITDEEQAKQRKLKGILNKLTPQNFEKLFEQVKEVKIDNATTLTGVISQIFDKALMEPTFCEMYANFCYYLSSELPDLSVENEITFRRLLLNKCQEEFERGEQEEREANNETDGEGEVKQTEQQREEKRLKARRRTLGNIRLIGELYKKKMLTERIMHECIKKLLGQQYQSPDEENIEALCKLMSTIGEMIDHPKAKEHMDAYFDFMGQLSSNMKLSSRLRFMLKDSIDLRKNKWQQRRKVEGPKKIEEVHRDAVQERQGQAGRLSRGPSMNPAMRRGQPAEFGLRSSMLSSPVGQPSGYRGVPSQVRGYGVQDMRVDERHVFDRTPSVPLPQRLSGDEPLTLGPQGGLARGMAYRGQPSVPSSPLLDTSSFGDPRRVGGGLSSYNTPSERAVYNSREDHFRRHDPEKFGAPVAYDLSSSQEVSPSHTYRDNIRHPDRNMDKARPATPPTAPADGSLAQNVSSEKVLPEERLRDMSISAIKEFYSAKDEKEVALCIKDLNAPSFYPTVVSIWVTDSFERKDMERDLLTKLLVTLTKPHEEGMFSPAQLIEGFESVLTNLEDAVNDAPRAPEFLGRLFGKFVLENVIPLKEVGCLIRDGGEEPGCLVEAGLAGDVLGSVLEMIKLEKGEGVVKEIRAASNLRLEDFRPPAPLRSRKLDMFL